VEDLDGFRPQEAEEGREIEVIGQGIDDAVGAGSGRLDQAELGPIGLVADEFGVEGHIGALFELGAKIV
jgi:hypothetical protein